MRLRLALAALLLTTVFTRAAFAGDAPPLTRYSIAALTDAGAADVYVNCVNNAGVAVGYVTDASGVDHATSRTNGAPTRLEGFDSSASQAMGDLPSHVGHDSGWTQFFNASAINDNGTIVGSGI